VSQTWRETDNNGDGDNNDGGGDDGSNPGGPCDSYGENWVPCPSGSVDPCAPNPHLCVEAPTECEPENCPPGYHLNSTTCSCVPNPTGQSDWELDDTAQEISGPILGSPPKFGAIDPWGGQ
tara:strand:+ start:185 stop:547 length:363 start_codon:yes stop_codon:yes gene_type:complete